MQAKTAKKTSAFSGVNRIRVSDLVIALVILLLSLTCILPFIHVTAKSVSSNTAVMSKSVYLWPKGLNFEAYVSIFRDGQLTHSMLYTVLVTLLFTVIGMFITICAAYPLSIRGLKGRPVFAFILMFTMYFSAGLIPEYLLYKELGLLNTMWVLVLPLCFAPYNMLIMRSFLSSTIPESLYEAAKLDGASHIQTLTRIVLPLSKPILATLTVMNLIGFYGDFIWPLLVISTNTRQVISVAVRVFQTSQSATNMGAMIAGFVMATLPLLIMFLASSRLYIEGITSGAVKA